MSISNQNNKESMLLLDSSNFKENMFYDELLNRFDLNIKEIKERLKLNNFQSIFKEKENLNYCKQKLSHSLEILTSLDNVNEEISTFKKKDLILKVKKKYNDFKDVKQLIDQYHEKLFNTYLSNEENDEGNNDTNINRDRKQYLKQNENEYDEDNDLTEHLLIKETKRNIMEVSKNVEEVNIELSKQGNKLSEINQHLIESNEISRKTKRKWESLTYSKIFYKFFLWLIFILLLIAICCLLFIKISKYLKYKNEN